MKKPSKKWTPQRAARFKALIAMGHPAKIIAHDPIVNTSVENVHSRACKLGIRMSTDRLVIPLDSTNLLILASSVRGITVQALIKQLFVILAEAPELLDNILDDGVVTPPEELVALLQRS